MKVRLQNITPDAELNILEIARVSSTREDKRSNTQLIGWLIDKNHWSPFEHSFVTWEIETSKAIAIQLLRHRSNYFQEFSQRYQDVRVLGDILEPIELRRKAEHNRQSSTDVFDPTIELYIPLPGSTYLNRVSMKASELVDWYQSIGVDIYSKLVDREVATECARFILPLNTKTKLLVTQSIRSLVHWMDLRDDAHAQKEIQLVAKEIKKLTIQHLPLVSKARGYVK